MARSTTGDWVSVPLGDRWQARCRLAPRRGRPVLLELHVSPVDGEAPVGEITHGLLRKLRRSEINSALAQLLATRADNSPGNAVYDDAEDELLALVAITYAEAVEAQSPSPSRDVWEFLRDLNRIESASDWPWGEGGKVVKREYKRSSVRTLVRRAERHGYLRGGRLHGDSATRTLDRASHRKVSYDQRAIKRSRGGQHAELTQWRLLVHVAWLRNQATVENAADPVEFVRRRLGRVKRSKVEALLADAKRAGYLIPSGLLMTTKASKILREARQR